MAILKYKGYEGSAEIDTDRQVCRGKILFIDDLVTYEAADPKELQKEFKDAVDDYLETCAEIGKAPQKSMKGQFNVRIRPELHKAAVLRATRDGLSLNNVVERAMDSFLLARAEINHNVKVTVVIPEESIQTMTSSASLGQQWGVMTNVQH